MYRCKIRPNQAFDATHTYIFPVPKQPNRIFVLRRPSLSRSPPILLLPRTKGQGSIPFRHFDAGFAIIGHMQRRCAFTARCIVVCRLITASYTDTPVCIGHHFSFLRLYAVNTADFSFTNAKIWRLQSQKGRYLPKMSIRLHFLVCKSLFHRHMAPLLHGTGKAHEKSINTSLGITTLSAPQKSREDSTNYSSVTPCDRLPALYKQNNRISAL